MTCSRVAILCFLISITAATPAHPGLYLWRGYLSGTDGVTFDLSGNWSPQGIPTSADTARFDGSGYIQGPIHLLAQRSVGRLEVLGNSVSFDNTVRVLPQTVSIGGPSFAGELHLIAGTLPSAAWLIGGASAGRAFVESGAQVTSSYAQIGFSGNATLRIDGAGSSWTHTGSQFSVGQGANTGMIQVMNGGTLTTAGVTGDHAGFQVMGAGSRWTDTGTLRAVAGPWVSGGATAEMNGLVLSDPTYLGLTQAVVRDPGSQWLIHGVAEIGRPGMFVDAGGLLTTESRVQVSENGAVGSTGAGSLWRALGDIQVGFAQPGFVQASTGGTLESAGMVTLGAAAPGYASVFGGGTWHYAGLAVGYGNTGSVDVASGGFLEGPGVQISGFSGTGRVTVSGAGSRWHITGDQTLYGNAPNEFTPVSKMEAVSGGEIDVDGTLTVGYGSTATVGEGALLRADQVTLGCVTSNVSPLYAGGQGTVRTNRLNLSCLVPSIYITTFQLGHAAGPTSAQHTVPYNAYLNASHHVIGYDAPATLTATGHVTADDMTLGLLPDGDGTCTLGTSVQTTTDLTVGDQGHGLLHAISGNVTIGRDLSIAAQPGSSGTVDVGGGAVTVAGDGFVGGTRAGAGGAATLRHTGAGSTSIADTLFVYGAGQLDIASGNLGASVIDLKGGVLQTRSHITGKVINGGLVMIGRDSSSFVGVHLDGDYEQSGSGTLRLHVGSLTSHDSMVVAGTMKLGGTLTVVMPGVLPHAGDRIRLASANGFTGSFAGVSAMPTLGDVYWSPKVVGGSLFLEGTYTSVAFPLPMTSKPSMALLMLALAVAAAMWLRRERLGAR